MLCCIVNEKAAKDLSDDTCLVLSMTWTATIE